jgi:hypothetical protein
LEQKNVQAIVCGNPEKTAKNTRKLLCLSDFYLKEEWIYERHVFNGRQIATAY